MSKDLYHKIDEEITLFINCMEDRVKGAYALKQMEKTAAQIGGKLLVDIEQLDADYRELTQGPGSQEKHRIIMNDAIRIKHEVREL